MMGTLVNKRRSEPGVILQTHTTGRPVTSHVTGISWTITNSVTPLIFEIKSNHVKKEELTRLIVEKTIGGVKRKTKRKKINGVRIGGNQNDRS